MNWIKKILKIYGLRFIDYVLRIVNYFFTIKKLSVGSERWKSAQVEEFGIHNNPNSWRADLNKIEAMNAPLWSSLGFKRNQFKGKMILDVGAGSVMRGKYFEGAKVVNLEPLAKQFIESIPWCDLEDGFSVYDSPAEEFIPELENKFDFIFSINVLDHCMDFTRIIENLHRYMKPNGLVFLSFDEHFTTENMHPLILTTSVCSKIFNDAGFTILKKSTGPTYGHGMRCLNFWLAI